jgi:hypothetical protein
MHGWAPAVIEAVGGRVPNPAGYLSVFYSPSDASRAAGVEALGWMTATVTPIRPPAGRRAGPI